MADEPFVKRGNFTRFLFLPEGVRYITFSSMQLCVDVDDNRSFASLGIGNNYSVGLTGEIKIGGIGRDPHEGSGLDADSSEKRAPETIYNVIYDWDGEMKRIIATILVDIMVGRMANTGIFPASFAGTSMIIPEPAPALPDFEFPKATPLKCIVHLGENGHSYVQVALDYNPSAPPCEVTSVNVSLNCVTTSERCITSLSLKVTSPKQTIRDITSPLLLGPRTSVAVEVTNEDNAEYYGQMHLTPAQPIPLGADFGKSTANKKQWLSPGLDNPR
ncbi:hypothetical protein C8R43DRAFT_1113642 [Mycena crocata]|nr:hypothetical protein C8R43DRAFT_1113642 [Mycena crocata]